MPGKGPEPGRASGGAAGARSAGVRPERLPPPGPLAPRRARTLRGRLARLDASLSGLRLALVRNRRAVVIGLLCLAAATGLLALGIGGDREASPSQSPGGSEIPLRAR